MTFSETRNKIKKKKNNKKIENIIKDRKHAHAFYNKYSDTYKAFLKMENDTFKDKKLKKQLEKYRENIRKKALS